MLLQNNKGIFSDVTAVVAPALMNIGIVDQAAWTDMDGDGKKNLFFAGMDAGKYFSFQNGQFVKTHATMFASAPSGKDSLIDMDTLTGWWYIMKADDIDSDGDIDPYWPTGDRTAWLKETSMSPAPFTRRILTVTGFDALLGYYIWGKCYPLYSRDQLIDQLPAFPKKFVR